MPAAPANLDQSPSPRPATASGVDGTSPDQARRSRQIDALMEAFITPETPGGAVLVIRDGQILHQAAYGMADLEQQIPLTPASIFHLGSVGKQFTAMAVMLLAEEGHLAYDDPIGSYLPELAQFGDALTIRHLLTHTSGLPDYDDDAALMDAVLEQTEEPENRHVLAALATMDEPQFAPGDAFSYSNTGYDMLGSLVEAVAGQPLGVFLEQRIFGPLQMRATFSLPSQRRESEPALAHSYTQEGRRVVAYDRDPLDHLVGSGSVYSTLGDLAIYEQALLDNRLVSAVTMAEALAPATLNDDSQSAYGFGWELSMHHGVRAVSHTGAWLAFSSSYARFPRQRLAIMVLLNRDFDLPDADLAFEIADVYLP
jgi:CubicO group peptidase (beta-lactamase class C family)